MKHPTTAGYLLVLILVFGAILSTMIFALLGYIVTQHKLQQLRTNEEYALVIAEAGLDYYKWFLAHNPDDVTNGGHPGPPFVHEYRSASGTVLGEYSLEVSGNEICGTLMSIDIESTGIPAADPAVQRTLYARYARPTVAEYSYIIDDNVWAGADRTIIGPYHSNKSIRMDGTNNSIVSSGQTTYECDDDVLNCSDLPGVDEGDDLDSVFGEGPNSSLWQTGVPPIDFVGITLDLGAMRNSAISDGRFIPRSASRGYRITFNGDNTFTTREIYSTTNDHIITSEQNPGTTYTIPTDCPLIFVEDKVWLEGILNGKVSIAAATTTLTFDPDIIIQDDITYTAGSEAGLLALAENDVLIGIDVPDVMEVNGIFIAQEGKFGRDYYDSSYGTNQYKDQLTINGTIVSNERVGTKWTCSGVYCSGFNTRINSFDRRLVEDPPPLTPDVSDTYRFIEWREVE